MSSMAASITGCVRWVCSRGTVSYIAQSLFLQERDKIGISGAIKCNRKLARGNGNHHRICQYRKRGWGSDGSRTANGQHRMRQGWGSGVDIIIVGDDNVGEEKWCDSHDPLCRK